MQQDEYRKLAAVEDRMWYFQALNHRMLRPLRRELTGRDARILDAGCGTGGLLKALRSCGPKWRPEGLDFSPRACELSRERTGLVITQGSITSLPYGDGVLDAVISADVVCQVVDGAGALKEFARCVRPGGLVIVNVPAFRWLWSYHDDTIETKHRYTRPELVGLFGGAGLDVLEATYANMLPLPLIWLRRKLFKPAKPTSDVRLYPAPVETMFAGMAAVEYAWTNSGMSLPVGSSVFVVGRKPAASA